MTVTRPYEVTMLVHAGQARTDADGTLAHVRGLFESEGAEWIELERWEERKLTYPIKGETSALYLNGYFYAAAPAIAAIERRCGLSDVVLRQLIIVREGKAYDAIRDQRAMQAERAAAAAVED